MLLFSDCSSHKCIIVVRSLVQIVSLNHFIVFDAIAEQMLPCGDYSGKLCLVFSCHRRYVARRVAIGNQIMVAG